MGNPRLRVPALPAAASLRGSASSGKPGEPMNENMKEDHPSSAAASRGRPVAKSKLQLLSLVIALGPVALPRLGMPPKPAFRFLECSTAGL